MKLTKEKLKQIIREEYQSLEDIYSTAREPAPPGEDPGPDDREQELVHLENVDRVSLALVSNWDKFLFAGLADAEPRLAEAVKKMNWEDLLYALMGALLESVGRHEVDRILAIAKEEEGTGVHR